MVIVLTGQDGLMIQIIGVVWMDEWMDEWMGVMIVRKIQYLLRYFINSKLRMSAQQQTLKWGDVVRIHGVNLSKKLQDKGLILSKGFTDSNVYYQKYTSFDDVNFYRESLFQLVPRYNFDVHDQLMDQTLSTQQRQILKARAVSQVQGLYTNLKQSIGRQIQYDSEVVFRHVESNSFLRGVMKAADTGDGAFRIQVNESISSLAVFRIKSHRSYEHEGDPIYYDDALLIYHEGADCYMNFAQNNKAIALDQFYEVAEPEKGSIEESYVEKRPSIKKPVDKRISVINQNKSKCYWKFILHNTYQNFEQKAKIKSHDIVYFQHTKNKGMISSSLSGNDFYLKESTGHQLYYECFWELIPQQVNQFGPQKCNNFWARNTITGKYLEYQNQRVQIESKQQVEGGGFINGHLVNLIFNEQGNKLERGKQIPLKRDDLPLIIQYAEQKTSKFQLIDVPQLKEDSFCIIKVEQQQMMNIQYIVSSHEPIGKFVNVIFTENQRRKLFAKNMPKISQKELSTVFKDKFFLKLNEDELINIINIIKLLAGKIYGTDYDNIGPSGNTPNSTIQKILVETGMAELLIEILFILYEPFKEIQRNSEPSEDRAIRNKISEIFQCTYKLLEKVAVGNQDNRIYLSRWVDLFLEHSNKINRSYVQECLVCILQNNPLSIEATINKDKINQLINSFFEEAKRQTFLTIKYLRLFSTFIKCEDRVIKENQQIILDCFFKNIDNLWSFKFKLEEKEEQQIQNPLQLPVNHPIFDKILKYKVQIALGKQDFSPIPKFFKDWGTKWDYFLAYVNLLADICMDRNVESIQNVSALISLQIVAVILNDPEIRDLNVTIKQNNEQHLKKTGAILHPISNVHEPFVRIAHYVYINNEKFIPIKRIKSISSWYRNENEEKGKVREEKINKTKRAFEGQKEEEEKCYLMNILSYIQKFIETCNQDFNNLNILLTVLNLLKQTIVLGLWESIEQFRKLIPLIIMRINKIENNKFFEADEQTRNRYTTQEYVNKNKDKLKLNRPELNIIIECKIKATEIFKLMNELEIDIRLRYMMNFFKGLYEATESFEDYNKIVDDANESEDRKVAERNETAREEFLKNQSASILGEVKKISQDQDIMLKQSIWYNKVKQLTPFRYDSSVAENPSKDRYLFQGQKNAQVVYSFEELVLAMFELPVFENHKLLNAALKMLREMFEQRKDMIDKFKRILICGKGNLLEVYMTLKYMRQKFNMLTNLNIDKYKDMDDPTFSFAFFKTYDSGIKQHSKRSGILQDLFFLARTLKEEINLKNIQTLMLVEDSIFDKKKVYNHLNEKEKNNNLFQRVNLAQEIYVPLIEYIKIIGRKNEIPQNHRRVLFGIYNYLALLCFNNLEAKQVLMKYIPDVLPHLSLKVGADNFLYEVCVNNKLLVNNEALVSQIIDGALDACIKLDQDTQIFTALLLNVINKDTIKHVDYEKGKILHCLRGILLYNDQGHKHNQELLINRLQDSKYKKLIYKGKCEFISNKKENFALTPEQSYIANHFELFAGLVETQNFINIGKLENIHPYPDCLECLKSTNRWQLRRTIRSYINRLYYVNKDRDIFLFEEFIRKEFKIINQQLSDLVELHRNKLITDQTPIPNGIRFKYALSQILELILQILITLHQMLLKPEFLRVLDRQIAKEQRKPENQRQIHDQFLKLITHLGCLNKLYPKTKTIAPFIKQVYKHISKVLMKFDLKYLNSKASNLDEAAIQQADDLGVDAEKKSYVYDHSKSFFRNLNSMIRDIKARQARQEMKKKLQRRKQGLKDGDQNAQQTKKDLIEQIYSVQGETSLKPMKSKKQRRQIFASQYKPHIQTANSKIFKVIAKPLLGENEQNTELNRRLGEVKIIIEDSPSFRKLRDDEFYKLVTTITNINQISSGFYEKEWLALDEKKSIPVVSLKQILTNSFKLIMKYQTQVNENEKIFIIKLARCYITEAVEGNQSYKLPVDKWSPEYYGEDEVDETGESQFVRRQNLIELCGGSDFIISLLSENLVAKGSTELLNETLLLGIAYLFNGNTKCQNSLLTSLKKDPNNAMLVRISQLIKVIGTFLIQIRKIKQSGKERSFAYKIQDTYDYFDSKENTISKEFGYKSFDKFQLMAQINYEKALCRIFRFLQLFCENNNVKMKHFLRQQVNDDEIKKSNSINFIDQGALLLRKLFKIMNEKVVSIPPCILDFINQITQMPCIQNQQTFMKSTFFEDISYLADFFEDHNNILLRKFNPVPQSDEDPYNQLKGVYQKGIELALVNFEGNDNFLYWQFLTKCQPKFLWICIKQNLIILLKEKAKDWGLSMEDEAIGGTDVFLEPGEVKLSRQLLKKFDLQAIKEFIRQKHASGVKYSEEIVKILNVFFIVKKIEDYGHSRKAVAEKDKENINKEELEKSTRALKLRHDLIDVARKEYPHFADFFQQFQGLILSIEVSSDNGNEVNNQFIYFPKHPVFHYLAKNTRSDIMMRVERGTQRDKQISLINMKEEVKQEIYLNYNLNFKKVEWKLPFKEQPWTRELPITSEFGNQVRGYARKCSFLICLLMVFFILVDHDTEEKTSTFTYSNFLGQVIIQVFCKVQLLLTLGFVYIWVTLRKPLALKKYQNDQKPQDTAQSTSLVSLETQKKSKEEQQGWESLSKLLWKGLSWIGSKLSIAKNKITNLSYYKNTVTTFIALYTYESGFLSILIFVLATFAGNFIGVEWYTIHIFDIFTDISELTNIFKAILNNFQKLTILSILAGAFILVFNVLSLSTYSHVIYEDDLPEDACEQIVDCVLVLYTSGAINDSMDHFEAGRFFFDIGYIVFMQMMFQNIVGGIMMDAFAGLKEEDEFRDEDKQTKCYICGMNKADMEKNSETFQKHIAKHDLWNYLYYILNLEEKDPTDFTGIEFDIDSKIKSENVGWFPAVQSESEEGNDEQVLHQLQQAIQGMQKHSNQITQNCLQALDRAKSKAKQIDMENRRLRGEA